MKAVLAFAPDAVILGADPPKLDCCDLLSEIKGSERTQHIRVLMLAPGGAAERARGLDLGADDVLSVPFDGHELLSRLRVQLRDNVRRARDEMARGPVAASNPQKAELQQKSAALKAQIANSDNASAPALKKQLSEIQGRIQKLESGGRFAQDIIESYKPSICL